MCEIFCFIVDNFFYYFELKFEWIVMENDCVDCIIWLFSNDKDGDSDSEGEGGESGKKKRSGNGSGLGKFKIQIVVYDVYFILLLIELDIDSESDEDLYDSGQRLRFKIVGLLQFYDVWGVKIFEKEIRVGKL